MSDFREVRAIDPNARLLWNAMTDHGIAINCFAAGEHTLLHIRYPDGNGWEIYTPATLENDISATVREARSRLRVLAQDETTDAP